MSRAPILFACLMVLCAAAAGQERSDLEIVRAFDQQAKALAVAVDSAKTVQECADIRVSVEQLRTEFGVHKELLDKSLYGQNYDQRLAAVSGQLMLAEGKLGVIETQISRIVELETEVRRLSAEMERLAGENTNLLSEVERLAGNIKKLSASGTATGSMIDSMKKVITQLQGSLRERDDMIFALVDSMFMQYGKDLTQVGDVEQKRLTMKLDRNNVVSAVVSSIENNIRFLERAELKGSDLATMLKEQHRFTSQWKGIGPKLARLYVSQKKRMKELAVIDTLLEAWESKATEAYWKGLTHLFESRQIPVSTFSNGSEFSSSLANYITSATANDRTPEEQSAAWSAFETLWNEELHTSWIPLMVERGDLTEDQKSMIEERVGDWRSSAQPSSPLMYVVFIVVLIGLVLYLWGRMKKQQPPTPAP